MYAFTKHLGVERPGYLLLLGHGLLLLGNELLYILVPVSTSVLTSSS